mmetsp:Transcript_14198/g.25409  ORF Transcript_14198/g.25409 Transcript_14198/m.25409 type:complete len:283 (-) Transcript_14198:237-1085(-)|eukprot:CAMPEP_0184519820 /NCGR_PEP_ID=MMETSP0198_2-20121128/6833_1 /TAXON_ID=1112570 /ORGANISM="Thraustochytrium sp., Strain LLF1b" /LENGTH=282 /DNA_ID=CAMNT_0026910367 /DNA_START=357 /DNA_END=1205 /DNA_ORIENTATION=+
MSRIRQVVIATRDIRKAQETAGKMLETFPVYTDPELAHFGLENVIMPLGHSFLEFITPLEDKGKDNNTVCRFLGDSHASAGYMVLVQVPNPDAIKQARQTAVDLGLRIVHEGSRAPGEKGRFDWDESGPGLCTPGVAGFHLHHEDVGCVCEISVSNPRAHWEWAGSEWRGGLVRTKIAHSSTQGIAGVTIATEDPSKVAENWIALLALDRDNRVHESPDGSSVVLVLDDESELELRKPKHPSEKGLVGIRVLSSSSKLERLKDPRIGNVTISMDPIVPRSKL